VGSGRSRCPRGRAAAIARVLDPRESLNTALLVYPSGPRGRPLRTLGAKASKLDGGAADELCSDESGTTVRGYDDAANRRLCYGQPRFTTMEPGRRFWRASKPQNRRLQAQGGPSQQHAVEVAHAGLRSLLLLAALGLAPAPSEGDADGARARASDCSVPLLGDGVAATARYTWRVLAANRTTAAALRALATVKGFYLNHYPAAFHIDADRYMESYSLRQSGESRARAGGRTPGAILLPQLGLKFTSDPNRTVWAVCFARLWHAAEDLGAWSDAEVLGRGAGDAFHLQSRGSEKLSVCSEE
jgi:hypothetical protein